MMKRRKMKKRASKKLFKRTASKMHPRNFKKPAMRGGNRW